MYLSERRDHKRPTSIPTPSFSFELVSALAPPVSFSPVVLDSRSGSGSRSGSSAVGGRGSGEEGIDDAGTVVREMVVVVFLRAIVREY